MTTINDIWLFWILPLVAISVATTEGDIKPEEKLKTRTVVWMVSTFLALSSALFSLMLTCLIAGAKS